MARRPWPALIWWAAVVVWMGVIFALSAQNGGASSGLSDMVVRVLRQVSGDLLARVAEETLQLVVRKCAHFGAYLILGALVAGAWRCWPGRRFGAVSGGDLRRTAGRWWRISDWSRLGPVVVAAAYAVTDEIHQSFVAGRSAQVTDVLIDTAGALVGVGLVAMLTRGARKRQISAQGAR
ncbi:MAG TPA: VanZ family protein [Nakamurella sp.]|nr:VanZ family protein [Nakamurella sp.]